MWTSRANRRVAAWVIARLVWPPPGAAAAYWNHKWLNVSQTALIQVEPGEKLAGGLNIIEAF